MEDSSLTKKLNMPSLCSPCRCRANANGWSSLTHTGERASLACYECVPQHFVDASCSFLLVPQASSGLRKSQIMLHCLIPTDCYQSAWEREAVPRYASKALPRQG